MIARVRAWYAALTARERTLVTIAGALAGLIVLIYGIVLPVGRAFDATDARHVASVQRTERLMAALRLLDERPAGPASRAAAGSVEQVVAASAEQAGFVLQSNQPRGGDMTAIVIASARPGPVLAWLDALAGMGVIVDTLTMTPAPDGSVAVNATLRRSGT
ncbi:type II secretion system protein GspM [Novosphingobium sp. EMRT-2]|uniref:type II secretion system protein GspM n=1 Tax=Novosphingobium sp. EMRT-2 TaxID=2571749 RepID=UPI0010BDADD0|nr:type II secretion system protein GspM [Novosphingobium sp. EMRT-2]QCI94505.1 type II secretion system protein M [Novosphingobium sp. EMRT-2]